MRKTAIIGAILLTLIFLTAFTVNSVGVTVQPAEVYIKMTGNYISGNTTKKIIVTNVENHNVSVLAYIEKPYPDYIRPNRIPLQNLSWINIVPFQYTLQPNTSKTFYLYLTIPEKFYETLLDKQWEVWATFREEASNSTSNSFVKEYSVRIYIDTPKYLVSSTSLRALTFIYLILFAAIAIFFLLIMVHRKNR
jgi:hypothetical protein